MLGKPAVGLNVLMGRVREDHGLTGNRCCRNGSTSFLHARDVAPVGRRRGHITDHILRSFRRGSGFTERERQIDGRRLCHQFDLGSFPDHELIVALILAFHDGCFVRGNRDDTDAHARDESGEHSEERSPGFANLLHCFVGVCSLVPQYDTCDCRFHTRYMW